MEAFHSDRTPKADRTSLSQEDVVMSAAIKLFAPHLACIGATLPTDASMTQGKMNGCGARDSDFSCSSRALRPSKM